MARFRQPAWNRTRLFLHRVVISESVELVERRGGYDASSLGQGVHLIGQKSQHGRDDGTSDELFALIGLPLEVLRRPSDRTTRAQLLYACTHAHVFFVLVFFL